MADRDRNALAKPLDQGFISRVASGLKYVFTGKSDWFGPGDPMPSIVVDQVAAGTEGRAWDYPVAINKTIPPRQNEAVQFSQMRALADSLDILRLAIETRKDQLTKLAWTIKPVEGAKVTNSRLKALKAFFRRPDKELQWSIWLRKLLEDYYVIDAATIWPRRTRGRDGTLHSLEIIDGATIKRCIDLGGRTPQPPDVAYQQILKGVVAAEYSRDKLIYRPHNVRSHKLYGYSHVEQIIITVNIALRRQMNQLDYFTEGNVPEALGTVPEGWNPDQIKEWQTYWDAICEGVLAVKRKMKWVPAGMNYIPTKEEILKNEFDEWLARIVSYCFSLPPTPFVKQMNRATAEQQEESAEEEGLVTDMMWVKGLMDDILELHLDSGDCEWSWEQEKSVDTKIQAEVDEIHINTGVRTPKQVAIANGFEWDKENEEHEARRREAAASLGLFPAGDSTAPPSSKNGPESKKSADKDASAEDSKSPESKQDKSTLEKAANAPAGKRLKPVPLDRAVVRKAVNALHKLFADFLSEQASRLSDKIGSRMEKAAPLRKIGLDSLDEILEELEIEGWTTLVEPTSSLLAKIFTDTAHRALSRLGMADEGITDLVHEKAVEWAKARAAELVGKRWVDGELIDNPNARWTISDTTRDMLRDTVSRSLEEGPSSQDLAREIRESFAFSDHRAEMIARTELADAHSEGSLQSYREANGAGLVVLKEWLLGQDDYCDECKLNAAAGPIPVDDPFPSGDLAPTVHPHCRCSVAPYVLEVEEGQEPFK